MKCLPNRVVWLVWKSTFHNKTLALQYNICLNFLIAVRKSNIKRAISVSQIMCSVQAVPIITNSMSLNPTHAKMYSIQLYMIHFFSELRQDDSLLRVLRFLQTIKLIDKI
jgi:hypothetical protein